MSQVESRRVVEDVTAALHGVLPAGLPLCDLTQRNQHSMPYTWAKELQAEENHLPADIVIYAPGEHTGNVMAWKAGRQLS